MVDVEDSKSSASDGVPVRVRSPAPSKEPAFAGFFFYLQTGLEPIQIRSAGGRTGVRLLPNTTILWRSQKQIESGHRHQVRVCRRMQILRQAFIGRFSPIKPPVLPGVNKKYFSICKNSLLGYNGNGLGTALPRSKEAI